MISDSMHAAYRATQASCTVEHTEQRALLLARAARIIYSLKEHSIVAAALRAKSCHSALLEKIATGEIYSKSEERRFRRAVALAQKGIDTPQTGHTTQQWRTIITAFIVPVVAMLLLSQVLGMLHTSYVKHANPPEFSTQNNYERTLASLKNSGLKLAYHAELGRNQQVATAQTVTEGYSVEPLGFSVGRAWKRRVSWYIEAAGRAELIVRFPPQGATKVAIFMTDGDSIWRMSSIRSDGQVQTSDRAYNGRWKIFSVSERERQSGIKRFSFQQLTGETIAVSAVAILTSAKQSD